MIAQEHGPDAAFEWGDFGDLADLIDDMIRLEGS
jgi:hypothetical protein